MNELKLERLIEMSGSTSSPTSKLAQLSTRRNDKTSKPYHRLAAIELADAAGVLSQVYTGDTFSVLFINWRRSYISSDIIRERRNRVASRQRGSDIFVGINLRSYSRRFGAIYIIRKDVIG